MLAAVVMATAAVAAGSQPVAVAGEAAPATGHAQVVAQALLEFGPDAYQWALAEIPVESDGVEVVADAPTFLLAAGGGAVLLTGSDGTRWRLSGGEAAFRYTGTTTNADNADNAGEPPATLLAISLGDTEPAAGTVTAVTPGAGFHDVDLIRDVLATGETLTLNAPVAAFVVVTAGTVADAAAQPVATGDTATGAGELSFTNDGEQPATVVAAVIGPVVDDEALTPASDSAAVGASDTSSADVVEASEATATTEPATGSSGATESTPPSGATESTGPTVGSGPAEPPPPAPSGPVTVSFSPSSPPPGGSIDVTGTGCHPGETVIINTWGYGGSGPDIRTRTTADGSGAFAAAATIHSAIPPGVGFGVQASCGDVYPAPDGRWSVTSGNAALADPGADSDGDGLTDGDEVSIHGTDPHAFDTDGDGYSDNAEINVYGTDPQTADSDDDGLDDASEIRNGVTDPTLYDTDDDGVGDGDEIAAGTDPLNP